MKLYMYLCLLGVVFSSFCFGETEKRKLEVIKFIDYYVSEYQEIPVDENNSTLIIEVSSKPKGKMTFSTTVTSAECRGLNIAIGDRLVGVGENLLTDQLSQVFFHIVKNTNWPNILEVTGPPINYITPSELYDYVANVTKKDDKTLITTRNRNRDCFIEGLDNSFKNGDLLIEMHTSIKSSERWPKYMEKEVVHETTNEIYTLFIKKIFLPWVNKFHRDIDRYGVFWDFSEMPKEHLIRMFKFIKKAASSEYLIFENEVTGGIFTVRDDEEYFDSVEYPFAPFKFKAGDRIFFSEEYKASLIRNGYQPDPRAPFSMLLPEKTYWMVSSENPDIEFWLTLPGWENSILPEGYF
jgi:hypothetical protein